MNENSLDGIRVLEINHYGLREHQNAYKVLVQRGSLLPDEKIKYVKRYKQRIQKDYGIERSITRASAARLTSLFNGFDGGARPENVEVEYYLGLHRMDITFSVYGRLEKQEAK